MNPLSTREMQVADLVHQGKIEKEIATELYISLETVRTHTKNIRRKLNARNIADITRIYILELNKPAKVLIMFFFLSLQGFIMVQETNDMLRPQKAKTAKVQRARRARRELNT